MFNVQKTCLAPCVDIVTIHNATVVQRLDCMGSSRSRVHEHLHLVTHLFCTGGSSIGFLGSCMQTDSGNRNNKWPSVLSILSDVKCTI